MVTPAGEETRADAISGVVPRQHALGCQAPLGEDLGQNRPCLDSDSWGKPGLTAERAGQGIQRAAQ